MWMFSAHAKRVHQGIRIEGTGVARCTSTGRHFVTPRQSSAACKQTNVSCRQDYYLRFSENPNADKCSAGGVPGHKRLLPPFESDSEQFDLTAGGGKVCVREG
jgi:hypothetical protein